MEKFVCSALLLMCILSSCVGRKTVESVERRRDSLEVALWSKDSLISAVFSDIQSISENLMLIKTREKLLTVAGDVEPARRPIEEINNDIAAIDRLLQENKARIASLQRAAAQLRKTNLRIEGLERMIVDLNAQLGEKDREVTVLRERLAGLDDEVRDLQEQVCTQTGQIVELAAEKSELQDLMNTVYYIVGSQKELLDAQIINKQGFIGRTVTVGRGRNLESFTRADARFLEELPIGRKKVQIVTTHPEESYRLVTGNDKTVRTLEILDPERFWESSKVLIVTYK